MVEFRRVLDGRSIAYDADSLSVHADIVKRAIKAEVARNLWGENERYHVLIEADPELQEALTYFPAAQMMVCGVLGPRSNAHGPNEFLHVPYAKRLTAAVAEVMAQMP